MYYAVTVLLFVSMSLLSKENPSFLSLDDLVITVQDEIREVGFTNKEAGHYYTLTNSHHTSGWQGWTVRDVRILDDYQIVADDYDLLRHRGDAAVSVYPHKMIRTYPNGLEESFVLLDSLNAFIVDVKPSEDAGKLSFKPRFTQSHNEHDYILQEDDGILFIALRSYDEQNGEHPGWTAITTDHEQPSFKDTLTAPETVDIVDSRTFAPAGMTVHIDSREQMVRWIVVAGKTKAEAGRLAAYVKEMGDTLIENRRDRLSRLLLDSYIHTSNERFNKALAWSRIAMDALIMNQTGTGIYAGLPWFNNYWGRDTFIAFSGGVLVTGQFETARNILRSFAEFQDTDPGSQTYGRIPNRVTTQEIIYNTTDGTPWFIRELYQYFIYSADTSLVKELYPVVKRSIEGALNTYADEYYFLTHADADTWMDAVGPDGPWSPRGNRAVDIQYLWYRQLTDGAAMAEINGDDEYAAKWSDIAQTLRSNFNHRFIDNDGPGVYDRLKQDGTPDARVRPNQIFAFDMIDNDDVRKAMLRTVVGELTYPWGVASLSQYNKDFHPYHHNPPYYVPDAAYHNGIVWTWLIGRVIEAAVQYDLQDRIYDVTDNMVRQILERGGVGTFSELLDAFPREEKDEPELSGTFTQAWNLAEFIRAAYQDYLGIRVNVSESEIILQPKIPEALGNVKALIPFGNKDVSVVYYKNTDSVHVCLTSDNLDKPVRVHLQWVLDSGDAWHATGLLEPGEALTFVMSNERIVITPGTHAEFQRIDNASRRPEFAGLSLAEPEWQDYWTSLKGPDYPLLTHEIVKTNRGDAPLLYDIEDDAYDDKGPGGTYTYPTNPNFKDGILDITRFSVWGDDNNTYFRLRFRSLHDPGFHPHYGFQLTYAAILIDRGNEGPGMRDAGFNSNYMIDPATGTFDRGVYVGGGMRVVDAEKNIVCEYLPAPEDVVDPLGDVRRNEITFAIPNEYLGRADGSWRYLVLVGAQDDHGGAGIGVFRDVQRTAGEWHGGGKQNPDDPNIYDMIVPQQ